MAKNPLILDCPNGWQYFGGTHSCYKVMESVQSWNNAKRSCQDHKADLASITDEATNIFVTSLTKKTSWIGGYLDSDKKWKWTDGSRWGYTNWYPGEPNNAGGKQDKLIINHWRGGVGKWDDNEEKNKRSFICQKKLKQGD